MDSVQLTSTDEDISRESGEILPLTRDESLRRRNLEVDSTREGSEETRKSPPPPPPSATLRSSPWILALASTYAALAMFAWTLLCVLTYRPVTTAHYHTLMGTRDTDPRSVYAQNERWLRAVRVVQSIVSILTIPVISAVCSKAAVVFTQNSRKRRNLSLRKTITLASRGWNEPNILFRLFRGQYERYGTSLLLFAIFLNILGGLISPLQSAFLHYSTTKTPTSLSTILYIPDVRDLFDPVNLDTANRVAVLTRSAITSTFNTDPQSRLWSHGWSNCDNSPEGSPGGPAGIWDVQNPQLCDGQVANLANMSQLVDPFVAYLPAAFNTGLLRQYIPRMNSSVTKKVVTAAEFPADCSSLPGSFYVHYSHAGEANDTNWAGNWSVMACMPANQSTSPWKGTRDRQDISEQLYLNISMNTFTRRNPLEAFLEITLNSTLGYFELPNYFNGKAPGPLLDKSPWPAGYSYPQLPPPAGQYRRDVNNDSAGMSSSSVILQQVANKGPLLNLAMALFGENSFIANRFQHPEVYLWNLTNAEMWAEIDHGANEELFKQVCVEQEPLMGLLLGPTIDLDNTHQTYPGCIMNLNSQDDKLQSQIEEWILSLYNAFPSDIITNAFEAAAFLANEAWLVKSVSIGASLSVSYDLGTDTDIPVISEEGIVLISVLLFIFLVALLALAIYSTRTPVWTSNLDAFAMIRVGASMPDKLSLTYVQDPDKVAILDEEPGWIGDATEGHGVIGELGLGANAHLAKKRKIRCYED